MLSADENVNFGTLASGGTGITIKQEIPLVLKLTFACGPYDRMDALRTGDIRIPGVELDVVTIQSPRELFDKVSQGADFHLAEMSVSEFVSETCNGQSNHVALPIFPSKVFRHGFITVNT